MVNNYIRANNARESIIHLRMPWSAARFKHFPDAVDKLICPGLGVTTCSGGKEKSIRQNVFTAQMSSQA
jgi:hypothetical protein